LMRSQSLLIPSTFALLLQRKPFPLEFLRNCQANGFIDDHYK
jgi:hypothetical protein